MLRALSLLPLCVMLLSCVTSRQDGPAMFADWDCTATATIENGNVSVVRWLGPSGVLSSTVVVWTPKLPENSTLRLTGRWEAHPPKVVDFERGLVMFDQTVIARAGQQKRQRYTIELRVRPDGSWDGNGRIEGNFALQDGVRLSADWADVEAMARGADRLFLIVKDRRGMAVLTQALQGSLFTGFRGAAEGMMEESATMARDFRKRCRSNESEDIVP